MMCVGVSDFHQHWFSKLKGNMHIKKEIPKTVFVDAKETSAVKNKCDGSK